MSTKHDHGYSYWERRCTNLLLLTHGPQKAFEASFTVHQICFRLIGSPLGITGVKYGTMNGPKLGHAPIKRGLFFVLDPFNDLASKSSPSLAMSQGSQLAQSSGKI